MEKNVNSEGIKRVSDLRVGVIGMGNIGRAMVRGLLNSELLSTRQISISNRTRQSTEEKCGDLLGSGNLVVAENNGDLVSSCNTVVVALKQNAMKEELEKWSREKVLSKQTIIVSFAAGVKIDTIKRWLGNKTQPVIRVMPNTPTAIGRGVFGWTASDEITLGQLKSFKRLFRDLGTEILVGNEEDIDSITAISGSGPAYFYLLAEYMVESAKQMGLTEKHAEQIVKETFIGAAELLDKTGEQPKQLRLKITSSKGTTEAAVETFEKNSLFEVIKAGAYSAKNRAGELGRFFDSL